MIQTVYAALNGQEIRNISIEQIKNFINNLPLLKLGNTFHKAQVKIGFVMKAYPVDSQVPEGEFEFAMLDNSLDPSTWRMKEMQIEELKGKIQVLEDKKQVLEDVLAKAYKALAENEIELEVVQTIDGTIPDEARIKANQPIPVATITAGGKRVENYVQPSELKKGGINFQS